MTCVQIYFDFRSESAKINQTTSDIIDVSQTAAKRAVHTLDNDLALEVVKGLVTYPFISSARILDEDQNIMATLDNITEPSGTSWFTKILSGAESSYIQDLQRNGIYEGGLIVVINNDLTLRPLYRRATYSLLSGFVRNIVLAIILAVLFNILVTKPLFGLATNIARIDYLSPHGKRLADIPGHHDDEIGHIINSTNVLITHLENHQVDIAQQENQLRIILDASPNQVFAIDMSGQIVFSNNTTAVFYGHNFHSLSDQNYYDLHKKISPEEAAELQNTINNTIETGENGLRIDQCLTDHAGQVHVMQISFMPFSLYNKQCVLIIANDISARVAAEERVEKLAYYDSLTSLPNRNQLHEKLVSDIAYTRKHGTYGAILFIDIDDFKRVNDTLGHSVGDELLLQLSIKMKSQLRSNETLARLGGDEFILSIPNISDDAGTSAQHAEHLADRILGAISTPIELNGQFFTIGASIGIATYPTVASDVEELLRHADTAMYQAKAAGRNCYKVFSAPMEEEARSRVELESEIRKGITNEEFTFHLQPLVLAANQTICGAEALIRWEHPTKGRIMPGQFISFLEQSPMVGPVGALLLDQVCAYLKINSDAGKLTPGFRISINVCASEFFQSDFVTHIRTALDKHNLPGSYLEIEITESLALEGFDNVIKRMHELKQFGITFALDDFGTGFSSLNYLKQLPVDKIKIDKSFIDDVPTNKQDTALVSSVIDIADNLNLSVVIEGVETKLQAEYFGLLEHVIIQGYWYDAPMAPNKFTKKYLKPLNHTQS